MHLNNSRTFGLLAGGIVAGLALTSVQGCDDVGADICGPCGTIAGGSLSISGSAELDGFFNATGQLNSAFLKIRGSFEADILALADVYGVARGTVDAAFVDGLVAAIKADIAANASGGLEIVYKAPECQVNVDVAVSAQASCEASADCDVEVNPGEVSVKCEGGCSGGCSGSCSGELSCDVKAPSIACEGKCEGSCTVEAGAMCDGTCRGECMGSCSATDAMGQCAGTCDAECKGTCELKAAASCSGTCDGRCLVDQGSASCKGDVSCRGSCDAECSGSCTGKATPPSASADCEASAKCEGQASAQASASASCTPPSLDIQFAFTGDVAARGAFMARIGELKLRGVAILQGFANLSALVTGKIDGEVVFDPAPLAQISASLSAVVSAGVDGELFANVPKGRLLCVIPAFSEAINALKTVGTEATGTIAAQANFAAMFTSG
jgi:hypothetical protein